MIFKIFWKCRSLLWLAVSWLEPSLAGWQDNARPRMFLQPRLYTDYQVFEGNKTDPDHMSVLLVDGPHLLIGARNTVYKLSIRKWSDIAAGKPKNNIIKLGLCPPLHSPALPCTPLHSPDTLPAWRHAMFECFAGIWRCVKCWSGAPASRTGTSASSRASRSSPVRITSR